MASTNEAIERLSFQATDTGIDQVTAKLIKLAATQGSIAVSASGAEKATGTYEGRLASIQSKYDALTRQQAAYTKALNDNTAAITNSSSSMVAANDNAAKSFSVMGIEVAEAANHLRVAGEAAYFFSPAFRSVVNGLAAPALGLASTALTAVAAGIVAATNMAGRGLVAVGLAAARSSEALAPLGGAIAAAGASMAAFNPSIAGVAGSILTKLLPALRLLGVVGLAVDVVKAYFEAWELGGKKLEEWRQIAEKAAAVDLSTSFFQKITKSATDAKLPVDDLTASMKKLAEVTAEKLGGSDLQNRLDQLTKAGNFQGNTGAGQLASANSTEEKFRAIVSLTDQAFAKGERLAALDLTSKFLSPAAQAALTKDSEYLHNMLAAADKLNSTQIVSDGDVGRALDLQRRYDAAVAILEQRWHPIQDLLTAAGIKMHEAWVRIVESIATAFDWATKLVMKIGEIGQPFWDFVKKGVNAAATGVAAVAPYSPVLGPVVGAVARGVASATSDDIKVTDDYANAVNRLAAGLKNTNTVQQAVAQTNAVQAGVWKDTSKTIDDAAKKVAEVKDQYDRAKDAIEKHTARMIADKDAVGLGVGAQEEFRARAQLTTAALQAGIPSSAAMTAEIDKLSKAAGAAAVELERAKVAADIKFTRDTLFLSPQDVQIATQLKSLYPDVATALGSVEAQGMRVNSAMKDIRDTGLDFAKSFVSGLMQGKTGMEALTAAAGNLATKMADKALTDLFSGNFMQAGVEAVVAIGAQLFANSGKEAEALKKAKETWAGMADQVVAFNNAAKGFNLGPLTNELQSLNATQGQLQAAAADAHDYAGQQQVADNFNAAVVRIYTEFQNGAEVLTPLQQQMKALNDEAEGLRQTLADLGFTGAAASIDGILKDRMQALLSQYQDTLVAGLTSRLNSANGKGYLNDATALMAQHQQDLSDAAILGNNPALLAQISAVFQAEAQKIIEDAGLVGDQFSEFTSLFPDFAGVVTESATALAAASDKFAALNKTINDYLDSLKIGDKSILSPQDQLGAAQSQFNAQLALAQAGNADALASITQYASTLLDQAKGFYASSAGYGDVYSQVTAALRGLTGGSGMALGGVVRGYVNGGMVGNGTFGVDSVVARYAGGGSIGLAGGEYVMPAAQTRANMPQLEAMRSGRTNDNGSREIGMAINKQTEMLARDNEELRAVVSDMKQEIKSLNTKLALVLAAA